MPIAPESKGIPTIKWMPEPLWKESLKYIPVPCLDIIFERGDGSILYGYRKISPYNKVWALIGGRMLFGEGMRDAARRLSREHGMMLGRAYLVGVFPVTFQDRSDVSIAIASPESKGKSTPDGQEFNRLQWRSRPPRNLGDNYRKMVVKWMKLRKSLKSLEEYEIT